MDTDWSQQKRKRVGFFQPERQCSDLAYLRRTLCLEDGSSRHEAMGMWGIVIIESSMHECYEDRALFIIIESSRHECYEGGRLVVLEGRSLGRMVK